MVSFEAAKKAARKALESTYEGRCDVFLYQDVRDGKTGITSQEEVLLMKEEPCRLSFEKSGAAVRTETAAAVAQGVKLFLAPEIRIAGGAKIVVTQNGITESYALSGKPAVYATHQEIPLELFGGWA